jgi:ubiquinol-cytochrome c reductase iron-sulfur subunit
MSAPERPASARAEQWRRRREQQDRAAKVAAACFLVAIVAALGLFAVYLAGGQTQAEGVLLAVAFGGVGVGLAVWVRRIIGAREVVEERYPMRSPQQQRDDFAAAYEEALGEGVEGGRRRFLLRLLAGAGASLGLALVLPFRSLGPTPEGELFHTAWREGVRLAGEQGGLVRAEDVSPDEVLTVFPEDAIGDPAAQALLVGTREGELDVDALPGATVDGMVCYSKICTHAGCPVGLYRAAVGELICPCHQSVFDVNDAARVLSGPTGRPLPQLPIGVDEDGHLVALGDFNEPVGPSFWNLHHDRPDPSA